MVHKSVPLAGTACGLRFRALFVLLLLGILCVGGRAQCLTYSPFDQECSGKGVCTTGVDSVVFCSCETGWTGEANDADCLSNTDVLRIEYAVALVVLLLNYSSSLSKMRDVVRWVSARRQQLQRAHAGAGHAAGTGAAWAPPARQHQQQHAADHDQLPLWREVWATHQFRNVFVTSACSLFFAMFYLARVAGAQRIGHDGFITVVYALCWASFFGA